MTLRSWTVGLATGSALLLFLAPAGQADTPPTNLGKKVPPFGLTDPRDQKKVALADLKDARAIVVIFLGTECPINNAFQPRLAELHREYEGKGVRFLAINANCQDSADRVAAHARKFAIPFTVLKDPGNVVADQFGARRTPEVFLLDPTHIIRYQGRIDDQFGIGYQRPRPNRRDLAMAVDEVLNGKPVSQPTTPVAGCIIGRVQPRKETGDITFSKQVVRILQRNCQECHRPQHIGPMPLLDYEVTVAWSAMIREVVQENRMPPWHADPRHGKFANERRLSKEDRDTLLAWIDQGCPRGDGKDLPPRRSFVEGWQIGKPDLVLSMPVEFEVPAQAPGRGVPYRYFAVDPGFEEDRWVVRAEAKPGAADVVHHIIVFIAPPNKRFSPGDPNNLILCGMAPGDMPLILEPGLARKVPAGSRLVFQMHYTPNGTARKDRSSVGIVFATVKPKHEVLTIPVHNPLFRIPPGADNYRVDSNHTFKEDAHLISFMPHMHTRGKDFLYEAIFPSGKTETLLSIPRFDFNWQSVYRLEKPIALPKGTRIHCVAHFDNSSRNLNNPDPGKAVFWGDQTWEEMMIGWIDFHYDRPAE